MSAFESVRVRQKKIGRRYGVFMKLTLAVERLITRAVHAGGGAAIAAKLF
jgi:hypothetical protein